jgi:hypothetical protein
MEASWVETASAVAIDAYVVTVASLAAVIVVLPVVRRLVTRSGGAAPPLGSRARVLIEYLGNTTCSAGWPAGDDDRRTDRTARVLMDHLRSRAIERDATPVEVERLVDELRRVIRAAGPVE